MSLDKHDVIIIRSVKKILMNYKMKGIYIFKIFILIIYL